jgi:hypothetical protein
MSPAYFMLIEFFEVLFEMWQIARLYPVVIWDYGITLFAYCRKIDGNTLIW